VQSLRPGDLAGAPGSTLEAVVLNPEKLANHGLPGAKVNDKVLVTIGQNGAYDVKLLRTGQTRRMLARDGSVRALGSPASNAAPTRNLQAPAAAPKQVK
jgi:hypothetical protein